jgi:hypothetical protein
MFSGTLGTASRKGRKRRFSPDTIHRMREAWQWLRAKVNSEVVPAAKTVEIEAETQAERGRSEGNFRNGEDDSSQENGIVSLVQHSETQAGMPCCDRMRTTSSLMTYFASTCVDHRLRLCSVFTGSQSFASKAFPTA